MLLKEFSDISDRYLSKKKEEKYVSKYFEKKKNILRWLNLQIASFIVIRTTVHGLYVVV